jgi:hypothetical protein
MVQTQAEARFREAQDGLPAAMFASARGLIEREILAHAGPVSAERSMFSSSSLACEQARGGQGN